MDAQEMRIWKPSSAVVGSKETEICENVPAVTSVSAMAVLASTWDVVVSRIAIWLGNAPEVNTRDV